MSTNTKYPFILPYLHKNFPQVCFIEEHQFMKGVRRYKFDLALKCCKLAIEIEGGAAGGAHTKGHRGIGNFLSDMEKYNSATMQGWKLIRVVPKDCSEKGLTKGKLRAILDTYFQNNPCPHAELNRSLRLLYVGGECSIGTTS